MYQEVLEIAQQMAGEMAARGAVAAVLMGSHARGEAHAESDIDLTFVGREQDVHLERRGNHLVSISWCTAEGATKGFSDPAVAGGYVPAWRSALIIADPEGIAARIKQQAASWEWESIASGCDRWVAGQVCGYAEEVHRLVGCLGRGNTLMAAVVRSVLATRLAMVLAVHLRLLYDTENRLWDLVGRSMGEPWTALQSRALGLGGEPLLATCRASLGLYVEAAERTRSLLSDAERPVVEHACLIASRRIRSGQP